jgi:hypothetical protein
MFVLHALIFFFNELYELGFLISFFKLKDHPNESERKELGHRLGLDPSLVKFWFQNKRTKLKVILIKFMFFIVQKGQV